MTPAPSSSAPATPARGRARYEDWPLRLAAFVAEHRFKPFAWGEVDCCLFASNGVRALTGLDPAAEVYRDRYHDKAGAMRLVRKHGGIEAIAARQLSALGFAEWGSVALARRGDVVLLDTDDPQPAMGICLGRESAFAGPAGLSLVETAKCRRAWRID